LSKRDAAAAERLVKALDAVKATIGERFGRLELNTLARPACRRSPALN
jgi:hypothetical protein